MRRYLVLYMEKDFKVELLLIQCFPVYPGCCSGSGFRIPDSGFGIPDSGFRILDSAFRILDFLVFHTPLCCDLQTKANMICFVLYEYHSTDMPFLKRAPYIIYLARNAERREEAY